MGKGAENPAAGAETGLSAKEEGKQVQQAKQKAGEPKAGDIFFVIASSWFSSWQQYCSEMGAERPDAIDNTSILVKTADVVETTGDKKIEGYEPQLKTGLEDTTDYYLASESEWKLLFQWYGGGPEIKRCAISEGVEEHAVVRVEVYLMEFDLYMIKPDGSTDTTMKKRVYLSKRRFLRDLALLAAEVWKIKGQVRIWDWEDERDENGIGAALLSDMDLTIEKSGLIHGQRILVEHSKRAGVWPRDNISYLRVSNGNTADGSSGSAQKPTSTNLFVYLFGCIRGSKSKKQISSTSNNASSTTGKDATGANGEAESTSIGDNALSALIARAKVSPYPPGLCGLRNLGNTCFMNSALQCLSNTYILRNFFLEGRFKADINEKNALGMQGNIAKQFSMLMRSMWSGDHSYFVPKSFKQTLGRWAPQFEGFNQHDAHELLAFLLDGLHEDLNRISGKKPYIEVKEGHGRPDDEVALEAWDGHKKRNDSVIVDSFHGQLKSTVTCPDCNHISVTFDPFMYLSLPLQQESSRNIEISLWFLNSFSRGVKYSVRVPRGGSVADVRKEIGKIAGIPAKNLMIMHLTDCRFAAFLQDKQDTATFATGGTYMSYEFPNGNKPAEKRKTVAASILHRLRKGRKSPSYHTGYGHSWHFQLIGLPFILEIVRGVTTGRDLYETVWNKCSRFLMYTSANDSDDDDEDDSDSDDDSDEESTDESASSKISNPQIAKSSADDVPASSTDPSEASKSIKSSKETTATGEEGKDTGKATTQQTIPNGISKGDTSHVANGMVNSVSKDVMDNGSDSASGAYTSKSSTKSSTDTLSTGTSGTAASNISAATATSGTSNDASATKENSEKSFKKSKARKAKLHYIDPYGEDSYPFKLAWTNPLGTSCSICGNICDGCIISPTDEPIHLSLTMKMPTISIEWSTQIFDYYYSRSEALGVTMHETLIAARAEAKRSAASLTLNDCLTMYTTTERLSENDPWYCPKCQTHRCAWKKLDLWKLPEILVIHLKRFHFSATHRTKLDWLVNFPFKALSLDEFVINEDEKGTKYELFAVTNHMGGLSSGHYTANAKCDVDNKWYTFNDSTVIPAKEKDVIGNSAYVLFYKRTVMPSQSTEVVEIDETQRQDAAANATHEHQNSKKHSPQSSSSSQPVPEKPEKTPAAKESKIGAKGAQDAQENQPNGTTKPNAKKPSSKSDGSNKNKSVSTNATFPAHVDGGQDEDMALQSEEGTSP